MATTDDTNRHRPHGMVIIVESPIWVQTNPPAANSFFSLNIYNDASVSHARILNFVFTRKNTVLWSVMEVSLFGCFRVKLHITNRNNELKFCISSNETRFSGQRHATALWGSPLYAYSTG